MITAFVKGRMEGAVFFSMRHPRLSELSQKGFAALAGLAAGLRPLPAYAACCIGPYGTGDCGNYRCNGAQCTGDGYVICRNVTGFCGPTSACWKSGSCSGYCCDCRCYYYYSPSTVFYCYCNG